MKLFSLAMVFLILGSCKLMTKNEPLEANKRLDRFFERYFNDRMRLFPLEATQTADNRFNDLLPADFTDGYRDTLKVFFSNYLDGLKRFNRDRLNENDQISFDIFKREMEMSLEKLGFHDNYFPFNQFTGLTLSMGQLGSGEGNQPFRTVKDYNDWLKRATAFSSWTDSAIAYFRKGMASGYVLPGSLVKKMIPQMEAMVTDDPEKSIFYGPVLRLNSSVTDSATAAKIRENYIRVIREQLVPSYKKLAVFLKTSYLPASRVSSGINAIPDGDAYYKFLVREQTSTNKTAEEIYQMGLKEVARIRGLMDSVKNAVGFRGDLPAFFEYLKTDPRFMPYKTPEEVLAAFESIHQKMQPNLKKMFGHLPKTAFEIRQTEAFRAASASAEYNEGAPDGSRPGIFYVPILDATKFNTTSGMESLFLHEAIPGHHYQISLQQEDSMLPKFRRFGGPNAYVEGWALYCESLGKELGLYTDPYQYMGALGDEIHRAIRLVVDVAIHTKGMTREEAIQYMMANEPISEQGATAEIERYMAIPAQALSYKIGALKIRELRNKYQQELGDQFILASFHDELLKDGAMPLEILEDKMDRWEAKEAIRP
jgi:uncharacterized protein (DUF885 family)